MRRVRQQDPKNQSRVIAPLEATPADAAVVAMIQLLIPLGLQAVEDALQQEVTRLAGPRYAQGDGHPDLVRWGGQQGSVFLADQKLAIQVPRVRDRTVGREVPLATHHALQTPRAGDVGLFRRVLAGISTREYRAAALLALEAQFRRIKGFRHLPLLVRALHANVESMLKTGGPLPTALSFRPSGVHRFGCSASCRHG